MRFGKRLLSCLLILACLCSALLVASPASAEETGASQTYTKKKIVSVLYDTSGSMTSENRYNYARYASQTLMAMLGEGDKLVITPMHQGNKTVDQSSYKSASLWVDLSDSEGRGEAIEEALAAPLFANVPNGPDTPASSIEWAVQHLIDEGMKTVDKTDADATSDTEYFLVIMTDGQLDNKTTSSAVATLAERYAKPSEYASYQCIYLGFSSGAVDLGGTDFETKNGNVTTYKATSAADVIASMQDIANQISGRYSIPSSAYSRSGNTVTVDLGGVAFGLRSVSMLLQNSNATLLSARYGTETLAITQRSGFRGDTAIDMKGGSSAVLKRQGADLNFTGGTLTLTFDSFTDEDLAGLSILLEPALTIRPSVTHKGKEIDSAYINAHLVRGDEITVGYSVIEEGSGKPISVDAIPGETVAEVSYNGKTYAVGEAIPLVTGRLILSLSVSIMDGAYTLYTSVSCPVLENPNYFRVVADGPRFEQNAIHKSTTTFTVYDDNSPITSNSALSAYAYTVAVKAADGTSLSSSAYSYTAVDGKIVVSVNTDGYDYGAYSVEVTVRKDGNLRDVSVGIPYYPANVTLSPVGDSALSMTLYGLSQNKDKALSFALSTGGEPLPFGEGVLQYTVTLNGADVTAACRAEGSVLTFLPTAETLGEFGKQAGSGTVTVTVRSDVATHIYATASATLTLTDTVFEVKPIEKDGGKIDRFSLKKNDSSLYFAVYRDGVPMPAEELEAALADGTLRIDPASFGANGFTRFFTPLGGDVTVETVDGVPAVRVRPTSDQVGIFRFFTSMLVVGGDKTATVYYGAASGEVVGEDVYTIASANILGYILRIAILIAIIYLAIFAYESFRCTRFEKGSFVKMKIETSGRNKGKVARVQSIKHMGGFPRCLILGRLVPIVGLKRRVQETSFEGNRVDAEKYAMTLPANVKMQIRPQTDERTTSCMNELKGKVREAYRTGGVSIAKIPEARAQMFWESESLDIKTIKTAQLKSGVFIVSKETEDFIEVIFYVPYGR